MADRFILSFSHFKGQGLEAGFEYISQEHVDHKWRCQDPNPSSPAPKATPVGSYDEAGRPIPWR